MIEYTDSELGKIRVLNVTEARASFATVLGDQGYNYIITKNNKPLRVIVNYDEFESLKKSGGAEVPKGGPAERITPPIIKPEAETQVEGSTAPVAPPPEKSIKSRVRGMLEQNIKEAERPRDRRVVKPPPPPKEVKEESRKEEKEVRPKIEDLSEDIAEISLGALPEETDYFVQEEQEQDEDAIMLATPDSVAVMDSEGVSPEPGDKKTQDPLPEERVATGPTTLQKKSVASQRHEDGMTPEQREYFRKYKKLYESSKSFLREEGADVETKTEEDEAVMISGIPEDEDEEVSVREQLLEIEGNGREFVIGDDAQRDQPEKMAQAETPQEVPAAQTTKGKKQQGQGLPSLKDLLKELEGERLSGEDESEEGSLEDSEIDDLIHRITQD